MHILTHPLGTPYFNERRLSPYPLTFITATRTTGTRSQTSQTPSDQIQPGPINPDASYMR
ncbi:hypothetical protein DBV39_00315 [Orrella marina]|uniref:Uncharacterized protein n=1 Tax=Orrella marina TaxID=2163011 RepID=A0A2R4XF42_9BURK|nr:hypothetical protein DBV39_00315 [Orrella marina]